MNITPLWATTVVLRGFYCKSLVKLLIWCIYAGISRNSVEIGGFTKLSQWIDIIQRYVLISYRKGEDYGSKSRIFLRYNPSWWGTNTRCILQTPEKIEIAKGLVRLGIDVIEAGFPAASPGDFEAVQTIAREVKGTTICALARANEKDVQKAIDALKDAERSRLHVFIAISELHMEYKLKWLAKRYWIRLNPYWHMQKVRLMNRVFWWRCGTLWFRFRMPSIWCCHCWWCNNY